MISIEQVLLLEEKVESAVKKIEQLNAENAALREKVAELSNELNAKSEQFSSFQTDQGKIEEGILNALNRLNAVENIVLQAAAVQSPSFSVSPSLEEAQSQPVEEQSSDEPVPSGQVPLPPESIEGELSAVQAESHFSGAEVSVQEISKPQDFSYEKSPETSIESPSEQQPAENEDFTPEVDFEFGESDSAAVVLENSGEAGVQPVSESEPSVPQEEPNQPMFDIF